MICDGNICSEKYEDEKIYEQSIYDIDQDEFIKNLKHEKCKIIQLVRRQIHKFYDTQFELCSISNEWQKKYMQEPEYISYKNVRETTPKTLLVPKSTIWTGQAWCLCALKRIRRKICMVVLIAGIIALMVSIYGIYFHAYLCNNGKSCVTSLRYTHVKHALF